MTHPHPLPPDFVALDFETADYGADSACALALVRVERGEIIRSESYLIRPPRRRMVFTHIHGISWADVADAPIFAELWPRVESLISGAKFLAAHNAPFDRRVLRGCCEAASLRPPEQQFLCTVRLARRAWGLKRASLPLVAAHLGIELEHHQAQSDAEACARIVIAAAAAGAVIDLPAVDKPTA